MLAKQGLAIFTPTYRDPIKVHYSRSDLVWYNFGSHGSDGREVNANTALKGDEAEQQEVNTLYMYQPHKS